MNPVILFLWETLKGFSIICGLIICFYVMYAVTSVMIDVIKDWMRFGE